MNIEGRIRDVDSRSYCISQMPTAFILLVILFTACSFSQVGALITNHAPSMFIFGDSLADVGNNNYIPFSSLKANFYPNGIDLPRGIPTGRFCNGLLVLDIMASRLGFTMPMPYLSPSTQGLALLQGVNYASAGCGILNETSNNSKGCLSLSTQLRYHSDTIKRIYDELGGEETEDYLKRSLYFILIGSNDFLGNFIKNNSGDSSTPSFNQFIDRLISSLSNDIMMLYNQGARHMVLVGIAPIGCIPAQRARTSNGACNQDLNDWAQGLNIAFEMLVKQLGSQYSDAMITFANPYHTLKEFIDNPTPYGFEVTSTACCGGGILNGKVPCLPIFICCFNRTNHIFWDPWHPTEATNNLPADALLSTSNTFTKPWSIIQVARGTQEAV